MEAEAMRTCAQRTRLRHLDWMESISFLRCARVCCTILEILAGVQWVRRWLVSSHFQSVYFPFPFSFFLAVTTPYQYDPFLLTPIVVKYFSPTTNLCIIRVARDHHRIAWAAVTLIKKLQDKPCIPNVIHVSGTIKHAQKEAIVFNRVSVAKLRAMSKMPGMCILLSDSSLVIKLRCSSLVLRE